ncbi:MAG: citrate synthase, partial [Polyangiaceae bacterium]|nr:citrate synthase [Polyangiaceae bacterium]
MGIRPATLYAYVSRGLLASLPAEGKGRSRRYLRDDVLRLKARHDARSGHAPVAAAALRWGEPVLDTAVGDITPAGPRYRGILAVDLARAGTPFENVAEVLWSGALPEATDWPGPSTFGRVSLGPGTTTPLFRLGPLFAAIAARDKARFAVAKDLELERARRIIGALPWILAPERFDRTVRSKMPLAARICRVLGAAPTQPRVRAIDAALVLSADHELNVSSFAARVVASTGADIHACLAAAAAALTGPLHGGATERVEALLEETRAGKTVRSALEARARRAEPLPGLGHPLYPNGDPRAWVLLELAFGIAPR